MIRQKQKHKHPTQNVRAAALSGSMSSFPGEEAPGTQALFTKGFL